ncbi:MAG TPA: hypothetical protein VF605_16090 [Allosphingosinicella sp.]|jgi:hypothetical protein
MAGTRSETEKFPKSEGWTDESVDVELAERKGRGNCVSCDKTGDDQGWTLTTVWRLLS